jgi:hypothetical protein
MLKISVFNGNILSYNGSFIAFDDSTPSPTYDVDAEAYFARMTTQPTTTFKERVDTFIKAQKASGLWAKKKVLVLLVGETQQGSLLNMISSNHTPTISSGWSTTGVETAYTGGINTNFTESLDGGTIYTQNDSRVLIHTKTNTWTYAGNIFNAGTPQPSSVITSYIGEDYDAVLYYMNNDYTNYNIGYGLGNYVYAGSLFYELQRESSILTRLRLRLNPNVYYYTETFNTASTTLANTASIIGFQSGIKYDYYEFGSQLSEQESTDNYNQIKTLLQIS